jgi:D-hydroxyproline dehydrogenase subunit alpha
MIERYDVLVCGAGPAGLAAARAAAGRGATVGLIEANATAGGQIWRRDLHQADAHVASQVGRATAMPGVTFLPHSQVVAGAGDQLLVEQPQGALPLRFGNLVIATGARELLLPFPGWTLPGVMGAGGLQALVKQGWPISGKRVVVAGTGPLLLAAAASLRRHGAEVLAILEQAPMHRVLGLAARLGGWPAHAIQAVKLRAALAGVPYRCGQFIVAAHGEQRLNAVEIRTNAGLRRLDCDYLAVGYGLVPNIELAQLLGCRLETDARHPRIATDRAQRTSVGNVYAAGEVCGIGGCAAALVEGRIAGLAAAGSARVSGALRLRRRHARRFAALLASRFELDGRIRSLAAPDTVICRCEDVTLAALEPYREAREAKLATRCGMGACQGRICGAVLTELRKFSPTDIRPPLFPARLSSLSEPFAIKNP